MTIWSWLIVQLFAMESVLLKAADLAHIKRNLNIIFIFESFFPSLQNYCLVEAAAAAVSTPERNISSRWACVSCGALIVRCSSTVVCGPFLLLLPEAGMPKPHGLGCQYRHKEAREGCVNFVVVVVVLWNLSCSPGMRPSEHKDQGSLDTEAKIYLFKIFMFHFSPQLGTQSSLRFSFCTTFWGRLGGEKSTILAWPLTTTSC